MSGIPTSRARRPGLACFFTCLMGQACTPVIYELAGMDSEHSEHTGPDDSTGTTADPTPPGPTDTSDATSPDDTNGPTGTGATGPAQTCGDGSQNGAETDLDCGGDCKPCAPGQTCDGPGDCLLGICVDGVCAKPECISSQDCAPAGPCMQPTCTPDGHCAAVPAGDGEPCEDDDLCTLKSVCKAGACLSAADIDCSAFAGPCRAGVCNPNTGACLVEWLNEGKACDDGLECTVLEQCSAGECVAKPPPAPLLVTDFSVVGGWKAAPPWAMGPALRVRFCHAAAGKSEPVGGWSIDDLSIGAPQCF